MTGSFGVMDEPSEHSKKRNHRRIFIETQVLSQSLGEVANVLCDWLIVAISRTICIQNVATAAIQFAVLVFFPSDSAEL